MSPPNGKLHNNTMLSEHLVVVVMALVMVMVVVVMLIIMIMVVGCCFIINIDYKIIVLEKLSLKFPDSYNGFSQSRTLRLG